MPAEPGEHESQALQHRDVAPSLSGTSKATSTRTRLTARSSRWAAVVVLALAPCAVFVAGSASAGRPATVVQVTAGKPTEDQFIVSPKAVPHGTVLFEVVNKGHKVHGFTINGIATKLIKPQKTATLKIVFKHKGRYVYQCVPTAPPPDFGPGYNDVPSDCGGGILTVR